MFGNRNDQRRLDPFTQILGPEGEGDQLPDFVSPQADSETLLAGLRGNIGDVLFFTAYNLVARVEEQPHPPGQNPLHFENPKASIDEAYDKYSIPRRAQTRDLVSALEGRRVFVHVDHEAGRSDFRSEENRFWTRCRSIISPAFSTSIISGKRCGRTIRRISPASIFWLATAASAPLTAREGEISSAAPPAS
ncbi:MAG: hypothetical protein HY717_20705 [Planctomycetes bacterium]|nr:hypothetical protein [Planctomycetota bacterium]